jgi:hypothetical protein
VFDKLQLEFIYILSDFLRKSFGQEYPSSNRVTLVTYVKIIATLKNNTHHKVKKAVFKRLPKFLKT